MVVALVALFVAMSGVGYAAATIGSGQIKNNSVRGKDIRNSSVTGKDVKNNGLTGSDVKNLKGGDVTNESLTGKDVDESTLGKVPAAAGADRAGVAGSLTGRQKVVFRGVGTTASRTIYDDGKLTLKASCDATGSLSVVANTKVNHASLSAYGNASADVSDEDFLTSETDVNVSSDTEERDLAYSTPGGDIVNMQYSSAENGAFGVTNGCAFTAIVDSL
jgi:hypothetical protein